MVCPAASAGRKNHEAQHPLYHVRRHGLWRFGLLWTALHPHTQHRPHGFRGHALHSGLCRSTCERTVAGVFHDRAAQRTHRGARQQGILGCATHREVWPKHRLCRCGATSLRPQPYSSDRNHESQRLSDGHVWWAGGYEGSVSTPDKRGVDEFFGYICQFQAHLYYPNFLNAYSRAQGDKGVRRVVLDENIAYPMFGDDYHKRTAYSADLIHRHALQWLEAQTPGKPFFGVLTYTLPHAELAQPNDSLVAFYKKRFFVDKTWGGQEPSRYNAVEHTHAQFAAMITRLDAYVGEIMALLKRKGLDDNTLVIFTSDNGPHEEGGADPTFFNRDGKLRGLKRQCYEGGIRIPFIARWKGHIAAGQVSALPFAFYDLMPTFSELAGVKNCAQRYRNRRLKTDYFDGLSIVPTLLGHDAEQQRHPHLYWEFAETNQIAVRRGDWKLVVIKGVPHLYNLETDLHEDHDLATEHPAIVQQLVNIIHQEHVDSPLFPVTLPLKFRF